jgi:GNAT superfamily N-acetyltransferase
MDVTRQVVVRPARDGRRCRRFPHMSVPTVNLRTATPGDAAEIARLLGMLGYPTEAASLATRWAKWRAGGSAAIVAGGLSGALLGVVTLHTTIVLHRPKPIGRITALVVDESARGRGIGRALVAAAEGAALREGCGMLEVTSNMRRVEAHAFYEKLGYDRSSYRFMKVLPG